MYGDPLVHPQPETYWGNVNPIGPRGVYDEAKRYAEAMTMAYHRHHDLDVRIVRIFNTFGPRMRPDDGRAVSNFVVQALRGEPITIYGDGRQTRSFTYVDDEVRGLPRPARFEDHHAGQHRQSGRAHDQRAGRNWCSSSPGQGRPWCTSRCRSTTPACVAPTSPRPATELGWEPLVDLRHGLEETIAWFRGQLHV